MIDSGLIPLLLWRAEQRHAYTNGTGPPFGDRLPGHEIFKTGVCPWCSTPTLREDDDDDLAMPFVGIVYITLTCPVCGWWLEREQELDGESCEKPIPAAFTETVAVLTQLDYTDCDVTTSELGTFIRRNPRAVLSLSPRRFEQLVASVYCESGLDVLLTKQSHDGGVDVIVVGSSGALVIVECKHSRSGRTIGVSVVREVAGAAIDWGVSRAAIVTSGRYSIPARRLATRYSHRGLTISLVEAQDLLELLGAHNPACPSLTDLNPDALADIREWNRRILSGEASGSRVR